MFQPTQERKCGNQEWLSNTASIVNDRKLLTWLTNAIQERPSNDEVFQYAPTSLCKLILALDLGAFIEREVPRADSLQKGHAYYHSQGLALRNDRRIKEAVAAFRCAINLAPEYAESWFYLAVSCDNLGRESRAIPSYLKALSLGISDRTRHTNALLFLSSSLTKVKHTPDAAHFLDQIEVSELTTDFQQKLYKRLVRRVEKTL